MNIEAIKAKLDELKEDVSILGAQLIGIAITTRNRYEIFKKTYDEMKKHAPKNSVIVVVDDASTTPCPEATYRFTENVGIARAKNKCFELLYKAGCEHFFLFYDDRPGCGDGDMGLFNYIVRMHFDGRFVHGTQVNTVFKDEKINPVAWFKHK